MPVHKFVRKYTQEIKRVQPNSVFWIPKQVTHSPIRLNGGLKWEIFAQNNINIQPKGIFTAILGFGVRMTRGLCLISLRQDLKLKRLSLQDGVVSEDVDDIIITIQNNSDSIITINAGQSLCFINYSLTML